MSLFNEISGTLADQRSIDWERIRLGRFTASQVHRLMKDSRTKGKVSDSAMTYIREKIAEMLTGTTKQSGGYAIEWGLDHEYEAIEAFTAKTGLKVEQARFMPYGDHAGGSPDGYVGEDAIIEVKCPYDSANHVEYMMIESEEDLLDFRPEYYYQVQMCMLCCDKKKAYFVSYDPRMDKSMQIVVREINRNEEAIEKIKDRLESAINTKIALLNLLKTD